MEVINVIQMTSYNDIEVFSSAEAVVSGAFLTAIPEDKLSFFNHICSIAQVNIICNTKGNFTAQGSWKKILALEDILRNTLKDSTHLVGNKFQPSATNYFLSEMSANLIQSHSDKRIKEKSCPKTIYNESSDAVELCNDTNISVSNEETSALADNYSVGTRDSTKESVINVEDGNEIYVNITLTPCNDLCVESGGPNSVSDVPAVHSVNSPKNLKSRINKEECESTPLPSNKSTSEKDKRKIYEQQAPFKFFCNFCSFKSKRESHYKKHIQLHKQATTKLYICSQCGFRTIRMGHLRRHELQHAPEALSCTWCPYTTDNAFFLQRHHRIKHSSSSKEQAANVQEYLNCSHCSYKTSQPHFLKRHRRVHQVSEDSAKRNSTLYQCDKCNYMTLRKEHFERHQRDVHSEVRPFLCDTCGKAFKRADTLRQHHVSRHHPSLTQDEGTAASDSSTTVSLLHCCPQCSKPCRSRAHLKDHMASHSDERSFLCEICGSSFKTRAVQRKHIATVHANPKAFPCNHCVRRFSTKYALLRHKKIHGPSKDDSETPEGIRNIESRLLDSVGVSPKLDKGDASFEDASEIGTQNRQESNCKQRILCENERLENVKDIEETLPSSSVRSSNDVSSSQNEKGSTESRGCAVVIGLDGEMQSVSGGILTRTPAPSETTTALLYLTTDFNHYR
ncbi:zinc finger protein 768-like [Hetaerina americana]|uniref:zinc finger protein 768-like n=1 Tax=Hetaerina americana TaxID=62018 RepID=UPI003A7F1BB7